jgi:hypothetical protein
MGLLNHFRSRSRLAAESTRVDYSVQPVAGRDYIARLPPRLIQYILEVVCPHTLDKSYDVSEKADVGDGCMLCDLRDLARCAAVRSSWYRLAQQQL